MNLTEQVPQLIAVLPNLKANDQKFALDLIASFKKYGGLTPKQAPWIGKLIERATAPVAQVAAPTANVGGFAGVVALLQTAKAHLKNPKVRLMIGQKKIFLSLNGPKSKTPGFVTVSAEGQYPNRTYYGRVSPEGVFTPAHATYGDFLTALTSLLTAVASNPARVAKEHGKLTGNCCFCGKVLGLGEDQRSVLVGFGPVCADHYGLKAEWLSGVAKAEAKASLATVSIEVAAPSTEVLADSEVLSEISAEVAASSGVSKAEVVETLAESLAKATGAVSVTVTDGPDTVEWTAPDVAAYVVNPDEAQAELGPEYGKADHLKECFFCEQFTDDFKTLHGVSVCSTCVAQLK